MYEEEDDPFDDEESFTPTELKVVVVGVSGVGKTSICVRYVHNEFQDFSPTIGASFLQKVVRVEKYPLCLQIWDTAGQERFRAMTPLYYRNAKAAIVVFDATNEATFHQAKRCLQELKKHVPEDIVISVCANKIDKMKNSKEGARRPHKPTPSCRTPLILPSNIKPHFSKLLRKTTLVYQKSSRTLHVDY